MKNRRVIVIIVIVLVLIIGGYYGVRALTGGNNSALSRPSGTIEATTVNVSPELAGKLDQVLVQEGDQVQAGAPLFRLDATLLKAQQAAAMAALGEAKSAALTAQAAYQWAQAQYDIATDPAHYQAHSTRLQDWLGRTPIISTSRNGISHRTNKLRRPRSKEPAAEANLTATQASLDSVVSDLNNAKFLDAETRFSDARIAYLVARQVQVEEGAPVPGKARTIWIQPSITFPPLHPDTGCGSRFRKTWPTMPPWRTRPRSPITRPPPS